MADYSELKRLAGAALNDNGDYMALNDYGMAVPPAAVLALIAELEQAQLIGRISCNFDAYKQVLDGCEKFQSDAQDALAGQMHLICERDLLKIEVESLRNDAERYRRMRAGTLKRFDETPDDFDAEFDLQLDAAMGKGVQS